MTCKNNQEPDHTTPQQHESNRYKQQPIQREAQHHPHYLKAASS
jgi:hypothetical protein